MGYRHGFVIEYVPKEGKGVDCRNCINAHMEDKSCLVKPILFSEHGYGQWKHCDSFEIRKDNLEPAKVKRKENKKYPIPLSKVVKTTKAQRKKETELKNKTIISLANELHFFDDENRIIDSIIKSKKMIILDSDLQNVTCRCRGQLVEEQSIKLYLEIKDKQVYIEIPGKRCKDCNYRYVERRQVIERVRSIKKD